MSVIIIVTNPVGSCTGTFAWSSPRWRSDWSCPVMNPTGTMPYFFAAVSSFFRARSRAGSSSNDDLLEARQGVADVRGVVDREPPLPLRVDVGEGAVGQVSRAWSSRASPRSEVNHDEWRPHRI